jgi:hypothetical protein
MWSWVPYRVRMGQVGVLTIYFISSHKWLIDNYLDVYYSVCQLLFLLILLIRLLSKNVEVRTYKTIILPVVLYGCMKRQEVVENCIMANFITCTRLQV